MIIDPHKLKYKQFYWDICFAAAGQSVATRAQVGAVIVAPTGMLSVGWNGMPPGFENDCEHIINNNLKTRPEVIHAERNAIDKMTRQGVPIDGSVLYTTHSPCMECAKSIAAIGIEHVYFSEQYRDDSGIIFLLESGVPVTQGS